MNRAINGNKGNKTTVNPDEHFVPMFNNFPLTDLHEKDGELVIPDDNSKQMRKYNIENKK